VGDSPVGDNDNFDLAHELGAQLARRLAFGFIDRDVQGPGQPDHRRIIGAPLRLDGAAVDRDTLGDGFRPAGLAEQQIIALVGGIADRVGARRADPEWRMRLLHRRRLDDDVVVVPVLAVMREAAFAGPSLPQKGERLLIALSASSIGMQKPWNSPHR
jgi:hypothetical protein